jgi:protein SCO1/2
VEVGPGGFHGTELPAGYATPALRLAAADGRAFDLEAERGRAVLVFFGYTHCPDICPTTLATWKRVRQRLGADSARVRFVFVSVDPERDTPEVAARYARSFDPSFVGLSGSRAAIDSAQRAFRIASFRDQAAAAAAAADTSSGGSSGDAAHGAHAGHGAGAAGDSAVYTVSHPARVFVFDPAGRLRLVLPASASADATLADVRRLLEER